MNVDLTSICGQQHVRRIQQTPLSRRSAAERPASASGGQVIGLQLFRANRHETLLASLLALVAAVWGWDVLNTSYPASVHPLWISRQEALYLSGYLSIALMSLAMFLATRPTWLEVPLGGMDRVYRTHKWAGILAISLAACTG
jgi:hypothetical protein